MILCHLLVPTCTLHAEDQSKIDDQRKQEEGTVKHKYQYTYLDRNHSSKENAQYLGFVYGLTWLSYPLTQPSVFKNEGSWEKYQDNLGEFVFDNDEDIWNLIIHPISGSQLFLFYRANGYSRAGALAMTLASSTLFELTVEVYTEPPSIQDLYQTPVLGSILGVGLEISSLYLINSNNIFAKTLGHLINPSTLFWFYEGRIRIYPQLSKEKQCITVTFDY